MYKVVCPPPQTVSTSAGSDGKTRHFMWTLEYILARKYSLHLLLHVLARKYSAMSLSYKSISYLARARYIAGNRPIKLQYVRFWLLLPCRFQWLCGRLQSKQRPASTTQPPMQGQARGSAFPVVLAAPVGCTIWEKKRNYR
jgi:hypothetical protein